MTVLRVVRFVRGLPVTIRLAGGVLNPWLWPAIRACWTRTGPPLPPLDLTDDEWDALIAAYKDDVA